MWRSADVRANDSSRRRFYFRSQKDAQTKIRFALLGQWQGRELTLDDKGSMAMFFAADGNAKGYLKGQNAPQGSTTGNLNYAKETELATVCKEKGNNSF